MQKYYYDVCSAIVAHMFVIESYVRSHAECRIAVRQIPCNRLPCQPKAHDRSCVRSSVGPGFDSVERFLFYFFFFPSSFFFLPLLALDLHFFFSPPFFCPPLIFSSPFPLPSFLFSFYYSFPIRFLSFFTSCFPLSAPFLSLFRPFILFS